MHCLLRTMVQVSNVAILLLIFAVGCTAPPAIPATGRSSPVPDAGAMTITATQTPILDSSAVMIAQIVAQTQTAIAIPTSLYQTASVAETLVYPTAMAEAQTKAAQSRTPTPTSTWTPTPSVTPTPSQTPTVTPTEAPGPIQLLSPLKGIWLKDENQAPLLTWKPALQRSLPENMYYRVQVYHAREHLDCNLYTKDTQYPLPPPRTAPCDPDTWKYNTGGYNWRVSLVIKRDENVNNDWELVNSEGWFFPWHRP